jgi:hypothetical protein
MIRTECKGVVECEYNDGEKVRNLHKIKELNDLYQKAKNQKNG